jgi:hypothetical protein
METKIGYCKIIGYSEAIRLICKAEWLPVGQASDGTKAFWNTKTGQLLTITNGGSSCEIRTAPKSE